eukprot:scaffold13207_cov143-Cylindrotheca_fusiformis.AAC.11
MQHEKEILQLSAAPTWNNRLSCAISVVGIIVFCVLFAANVSDFLVYPILIAATASWFLLEETPKLKSVSSQPHRVYQAFCRLCSQCERSRFTRFLINDNNHALHLLTTLLVIIPCSVFIGCNASSHRVTANGLGQLGVAAMSYSLIPVSKHSILLEAVGIGSIHAVRLHMWAGFFSIVGGVGHGVYHLWIYFSLLDKSRGDFLPGKECWVKGYDSGCHQQFVYLTGLVCGISIGLLALTSSMLIRRGNYRLFYIMHASFSVILLFGMTLHNNKTILYLAPGLLYYMATNVPLSVEAVKKWWQGGNAISKVFHIPDSGGCVELSFRMPELIDAPCGKYVRLSVPEISLKSHPFTVFSHPDHPGDGKVIFRPFKGFTSKLSARLKETASSTNQQFPKHVIIGVHPGINQLQQALQHDTIVVVAAGVGIVTYISLLSSLLSLGCGKTETLDSDLGDSKTTSFGTEKEMFVHVHWACRDEGLIQYITNEYLLPLQKRAKLHPSSVTISFSVHHTGRDTPSQEEQDSPVENSRMSSLDSGVPVSSVFEVGKSTKRNLFPALTFSAIAWGGLLIVEYCYHNVQSSDSIKTRPIVVGALALWSIVLSLISLFALSRASTFRSKTMDHEMDTNTMDIECADNSDGTPGEKSETTFAKTLLLGDISGTTAIGTSREQSNTLIAKKSLPENLSDMTGQNESLNEAEDELDTVGRTESFNEAFSFHHCKGRPDFETIVQAAFERMNDDRNKDIGIFICGPLLFGESIRTHCKKLEGDARPGLPAMIYEEVYEM